MKLTVVLPCYNEEENIHRIPKELIPELEKLGMEYEILLIDDGSADQTVVLAENLKLPQLKIIKHGKNKGLGEAIKSGFRNANSDLLVTLDADFSFRPEIISLLIKRYNEGGVDLVIGSPKLAKHHEEITFFRWFVSKAALYVYRVLFGKPVTSVNQILRLYQTKDVKGMEIDARGFDVFAEVLYRLIVLKKKKFAEIPAAMVVRKFGVSKLNYKLEMLRHMRLIYKILKWKIGSHGNAK
ncbi:MAG: glycosyltransferase family 2 protein [Patescibacteria group bacterium]